MKSRTKDRLMTAGVVLVICACGLGMPGCATVEQRHWDSICTTDTDCEMHEREGTRHRDREALSGWKLWTAVGVGLLISGYAYAKKQDNGADQRGIDVHTPGVNCDVAGRPGGGCAQ